MKLGKRAFIELSMPLGLVYKKALEAGLIKPLEPRALPNPLPRGHNANEYCDYHQEPRHKTDVCRNLRHRIQDLIDNKLILPPRPRPNITTNPLPNHGQAEISHIDCDNETPTDCTLLIRSIEEPSYCCVLDLNNYVDEVNAMTRSGRYYLPPTNVTNPAPLGPAMEKLKVSEEPDEDVVLK